VASEKKDGEAEVTLHAWQSPDAQGWEPCASCGQRRKRVAWGWLVRVFSEGNERQVSVREGEKDTPCSMAVRFRDE
jgi:hypothetical protein